jgi:hypothetical protein
MSGPGSPNADQIKSAGVSRWEWSGWGNRGKGQTDPAPKLDVAFRRRSRSRSVIPFDTQASLDDDAEMRRSRPSLLGGESGRGAAKALEPPTRGQRGLRGVPRLTHCRHAGPTSLTCSTSIRSTRSYVGRDIFQTKLDCTCGAEVTIAQYREHLIRRHCNVEGCSERALRTVSFGFRDPQFRIIGVPMGICRPHEHFDREGSHARHRGPPRA